MEKVWEETETPWKTATILIDNLLLEFSSKIPATQEQGLVSNTSNLEHCKYLWQAVQAIILYNYTSIEWIYSFIQSEHRELYDYTTKNYAIIKMDVQF